ncbi:hypothetical protein [Chondromyces crocatus]|uniref:Uncharacterized protein n=1 Tax=Chondromyces crocatus TaxID=52 RepID=A0A0K1EBS3_CHOCO|nr:hypothetical protein [Chondromyces crocatus]AKT38315.1 uncharacterized protein CMC5_024600 [Chondromyces crocatus]
MKGIRMKEEEAIALANFMVEHYSRTGVQGRGVAMRNRRSRNRCGQEVVRCVSASQLAPREGIAEGLRLVIVDPKTEEVDFWVSTPH